MDPARYARQLLRPVAAAAALALPALAAQAQSIESALAPGPVIQGHAKFESQCDKCHVKFDRAGQKRVCLDCHKEQAQDVRERKRFHGLLKDDDCRACHVDHKGREAKIAVFDKERFDHDQTGFALRDKHKGVKCDSCHKPGAKYRAAPPDCYGCHKKDDDEKGHRGELGRDCAKCHSEKGWKEISRFDHEKTKFPIAKGKHKDVKCADCHINREYAKTPTACDACHKKDDQEKGHKGRYGTKCETCHVDRGWKQIKFDHDRDTKYPLKGKHRETKCDDCHSPLKPLYGQHLSTQCVSCHKKDDDEKGHRGKLGDRCDKCHNETGWKTAEFDHDKDTKFPLRGAHEKIKCVACHKGGVTGMSAEEKRLPTACYACHKKDDDDKGHKGRYGEKCETCHAETEWKRWSFDHDKNTKYPLRGKHRDTACDKCHTPERGLLYQQKHLDQSCISCHKKDDKHKGQLGTRCDTCHDERAWKGIPFDHNKSRFPLTGAHIKVDCKACHKTPAFKDAKMDCYSCHKDPLPDRPKTSGDVHKGTLGQLCNTCHNTRSWDSWDFDHDQTSFKLRGKHVKVACADCHTRPMKRVIGKLIPARICANCHMQDDVHRGGFGVRCERCHVDTDWRTVRPGSGLS
jgi:hypothetical protein